MTDSIVLRGGMVLTMDDSHTVHETGDVLVVGDRIEAVGPNLEVPEGTAEIDASGGIVMPGIFGVTIALAIIGSRTAVAATDLRSASSCSRWRSRLERSPWTWLWILSCA